MALDGEAYYELFFFIGSTQKKSVISPALPSNPLRECCGDFSYKVLADKNSTDELKNDKTGFLFYFPSFITGATMILQKYDNGGYADFVTLNNNDYGTLYDFGFFTNSQNENFIGYQLEWKKIIDDEDLSEGSYRIVCIPDVPFGTGDNITTDEYCLKQYTVDRAEGTVRIEYYLNGILGIIEDDTAKKDLGDINWYNAIRVNGYFGFSTATYETEYVQYNNGQRQYITDEQEPEYTLKLKMQPNFIHELMRVDIMQADKILITDYNIKNPSRYNQKAVIKNSAYEPDWKKLQNRLANVEVKFRQEYNNLKKLRC
jgi:hypothetical protein